MLVIAIIGTMLTSSLALTALLGLKRSLVPARVLLWTRATRLGAATSGSGPGRLEVLEYHPDSTLPVDALAAERPALHLVPDAAFESLTSARLSTHHGRQQVDVYDLEAMWLGPKPASDAETVAAWDRALDARAHFLGGSDPVSGNGASADAAAGAPFSVENTYSAELNAAVRAVHKACFMSRSMQRYLLTKQHGSSGASTTASKEDRSPVTVADFAVQALVISELSAAFPGDLFIAEESSEILRAEVSSSALCFLRRRLRRRSNTALPIPPSSPARSRTPLNSPPPPSPPPTLLQTDIATQVAEALEVATGQEWSLERLFSVVDRGSFAEDLGDDDASRASLYSDGAGVRVWVLDPIDGTKGFLRGHHYCIALALLLDGTPVLSAIGTPNLDAAGVLGGAAPAALVAVAPAREVRCGAGSGSILGSGDRSPQKQSSLFTHGAEAGSMYFAVTGAGAFCRALGQPFGAAFEVNTSLKKPAISGTDTAAGVGAGTGADLKLCEAFEAAHGDRDTSRKVRIALGSTQEFVRMDGMGKTCVLGAGAAEAILRLPPSGYREKIWDHAAGTHFVLQAGGQVTDLEGRGLDFGLGRLLPEHTTGLVYSNGLVHDTVLKAVNDARGLVPTPTDRAYVD